MIFLCNVRSKLIFRIFTHTHTKNAQMTTGTGLSAGAKWCGANGLIFFEKNFFEEKFCVFCCFMLKILQIYVSVSVSVIVESLRMWFILSLSAFCVLSGQLYHRDNFERFWSFILCLFLFWSIFLSSFDQFQKERTAVKCWFLDFLRARACVCV